MSRMAVLKFLREQEPDFISGEELSRRLSLSRAAVWKAVEALRREGYLIEAHTGLGYRLCGAPDTLTEPEIRRFLGPVQTVGRTLICYEETDSTNLRAKELGQSGGQNGTIITANSQTAGRGRMDRGFQSPKNKGIYLTALMKPELSPEQLIPVTAMAGVAVCTSIERVCGIRPGLKWPNDPVLNGKKLCGILTELSLEAESGRLQYLVLGIGINTLETAEDFSPEIRETATSLFQELGKPVSRPELAAALIEELDRLYQSLTEQQLDSYLAAYRRDCVNLGRTVQILAPGGHRETAEALDIDPDFGLQVRLSDGTQKTVRSGEVSVRGLYGYTD